MRGIRTMEVREAPFSPVVSAMGKASFDPEQVAAIGANALGTVRRVAKYEGDSVKRGDVLAEIGSASQADREAAGSLPCPCAPAGDAGRVAAALSARRRRRRATDHHGTVGAWRRVAFVVANLDRLSVSLSVDEAQARGLLVGDRVELSRQASPSVLGAGSVTEVEAAPAGSKLRVRVSVDNRKRGLRAGQAVTARIFPSNAGRALLVPNRALAWIGGQPVVFVTAGTFSASAEAVTLGGGDGEQTEVRFGLASGQRIVRDGVPTLKRGVLPLTLATPSLTPRRQRGRSRRSRAERVVPRAVRAGSSGIARFVCYRRGRDSPARQARPPPLAARHFCVGRAAADLGSLRAGAVRYSARSIVDGAPAFAGCCSPRSSTRGAIDDPRLCGVARQRSERLE